MNTVIIRAPVVVAICLAALLHTGCSKPGQPGGDTAGSGKIKIAAVPKSTGGEFWETVASGARRAASEVGAELIWVGPLTETEIAEQNKIIDNMINIGVKGLALAPLNPQAQRKPVEDVVRNGIPVVIFDSDLDGDAYSSFVATDNRKGGELAAEKMTRLLGGKGRVVVINYVQGTGSTEARAAGFKAKATANGLEIAAAPYPETGTIEGAKNAAANTLEGFVKDGRLAIDGVFAANLYTTMGAVSALEDLRKSGIKVEAKFIGFDSSKKLVDDLQAGIIHALVVQNPDKMGYLAVKTTWQVIQGETVPARIDTGVEVVTKERLANDAEMRKLVGLK